VHAFSWHGEDDLAELPMFEDTKLLAKVLFSCIGEIVAGEMDAGSLLRPFVAAAD